MTSTMAIRSKERHNSVRRHMPSTAATKTRRKDLPDSHPAKLLENAPYFLSDHGAAYLGDSLELLRSLPSGKVNLVVTSPPYALHFKKEYGNKNKNEYI